MVLRGFCVQKELWGKGALIAVLSLGGLLRLQLVRCLDKDVPSGAVHCLDERVPQYIRSCSIIQNGTGISLWGK